MTQTQGIILSPGSVNAAFQIRLDQQAVAPLSATAKETVSLSGWLGGSLVGWVFRR